MSRQGSDSNANHGFLKDMESVLRRDFEVAHDAPILDPKNSAKVCSPRKNSSGEIQENTIAEDDDVVVWEETVHEGSSTVCVEASKGVDNDMEKEYFLRNKEDCLDGVRYHNNVLVERFDTLKDNFVGDGSNDESNQFSQEKFLSAQDCHGRR
ncbi:unnamed protein product [Amaranthus hypochondriacus]